MTNDTLDHEQRLALAQHETAVALWLGPHRSDLEAIEEPLGMVRALTAEIYRRRGVERPKTEFPISLDYDDMTDLARSEAAACLGVKQVPAGPLGLVRKLVAELDRLRPAESASPLTHRSTPTDQDERRSPVVDALLRAARELEEKRDADGVHIWWAAAGHILKYIDQIAGPGAEPAPPHEHLDDHDPTEWRADCCACQNTGLGGELFVDESCPACRAQRDQDRPYVLVQWAVRHPSGVIEERVPEHLARRGVKLGADRVLLRLERIVTPDVVSEYTEIPTGGN